MEYVDYSYNTFDAVVEGASRESVKIANSQDMRKATRLLSEAIKMSQKRDKDYGVIFDRANEARSLFIKCLEQLEATKNYPLSAIISFTFPGYLYAYWNLKDVAKEIPGGAQLLKNQFYAELLGAVLGAANWLGTIVQIGSEIRAKITGVPFKKATVDSACAISNIPPMLFIISNFLRLYASSQVNTVNVVGRGKLISVFNDTRASCLALVRLGIKKCNSICTTAKREKNKQERYAAKLKAQGGNDE